jgi:hypothetical protein
VPPTGTWGSDGDNGINKALQKLPACRGEFKPRVVMDMRKDGLESMSSCRPPDAGEVVREGKQAGQGGRREIRASRASRASSSR